MYSDFFLSSTELERKRQQLCQETLAQLPMRKCVLKRGLPFIPFQLSRNR